MEEALDLSFDRLLMMMVMMMMIKNMNASVKIYTVITAILIPLTFGL